MEVGQQIVAQEGRMNSQMGSLIERVGQLEVDSGVWAERHNLKMGSVEEAVVVLRRECELEGVTVRAMVGECRHDLQVTNQRCTEWTKVIEKARGEAECANQRVDVLDSEVRGLRSRVVNSETTSHTHRQEIHERIGELEGMAREATALAWAAEEKAQKLEQWLRENPPTATRTVDPEGEEQRGRLTEQLESLQRRVAFLETKPEVGEAGGPDH